ncbi:hypothetical protein [Hymenobacter sp. DG25A]|uniref:hypothetical protein n=1 Tax=Hymenobacter sp. DG25A TaxID=1385663 RepID=UPI0006BD08C5|nr:hypothetical protein [Hymenobacter sp. DG25A]ALD20503.1 hypothetical protein AM218_03810 [Hymenobacter sp. DG25A]
MARKRQAHAHICWVQWQKKDLYTLWIDTVDKEFLWTDINGLVPLFTTPVEAIELAKTIGVQLENSEVEKQNLDAVWQWMQNPAKSPPKECLLAWNLFSDLSTSVGVKFIGDHHAPVRSRVFDTLYAYYGPWPSQKKWPWKRQESKVLKRILQQGFRLWQKNIYMVAAGQYPLQAKDLNPA